MGTILAIIALILFLALSVLRARLVMERCQGWVSRLVGFIKFPQPGTKRSETYIAIGQLTAVFWIGIGLILNSTGFQQNIRTAASPRSIEIGLLLVPLIVFLILSAGFARKEQ